VLSEAIGAVLPTGVAVALSPIPIVAVIVMLQTRRGRTNGPAFAVGWITGVSLVMTVALLALSGVPTPTTTDTSVRWGTLAIGLALLVLAGRQWRKRPRPGDPPEIPAWLSRVDSFTPRRSFTAGVVLSVLNPKNLALTLAAAGAVAKAGLDDSQEVWAALVFVVIASSSVVGLVAAALLAPGASARPLGAVREYMAAHSSVIMAVILLILGAKLIGDAISG
jgi:threonine/homoserine/homoserine lactone efflux protein